METFVQPERASEITFIKINHMKFKSKNRPHFKSYLLNFVLAIILSTAFFSLVAQPVVISSTSFTNNNGSGQVTFNLQNTNGYPIRIIAIEGVVGTAGANTCDVWYNTAPVSASPGAISTSTGWNIAMTGAFVGVANTTTTITQPFITGGNFVIPANTTYGIDIAVLNQRYSTISAGTTTFSGGGVNFITGTNIGWGVGMPPAAPTNTPRGWIGKITFEPAFKANNDAGIMAIDSPGIFCNPGVKNVYATIKNFGLNQITSATVNWSINGITQAPYAFSGLLDTSGGFGSSTAQLLLGNYNFPSTATIIKAWTSIPNFQTDTVPGNDSAEVRVLASLAGNYTIGAGTSNYPSITAAINDLVASGLCGPVVFNIDTGTYIGQYTIPAIIGSSAINTVTFKSANNNASDVKLNFNASSATDNFIVKLNNASYFTFKNLTFNALNASFSRSFDLSAINEFDSIVGCSINAPAATASSVNTNPIYTNGSGNKALVIKDNVIEGGSWGIRLYGTGTAAKVEGAVIEGNQILNQYYYGIYAYYHKNTKIRNNIFTTNTASITYYGLYSYYGDSAVEVTENKINIPLGGYGISSYYGYGSPFAPTIIANNSIQIGSAANLSRGINSYYAMNNKIHNNSVNITSTSATTGYCGYFYYSSATYANNDIRNNIFANTGGGYAVYIYNPGLSGVNTTSDYNLAYTTGTNLVQVGTPAASYTSLAAWRAVYPSDMNSLTYMPAFTSSTNLQPNAADTAVWAINGRAEQNPIVTTDMIGSPRPTTRADGVPDIGAWEVNPTAMPPQAILIPATPTPGITQSLLFANDTIGKIQWDQFSQVPTSITARLYSGNKPPMIGSAPSYMNSYWDISAPTGFYNYNLSLYYKEIWLGTTPNETDLKMSQKRSGLAWVSYLGTLSSCDTIANILTANWLTGFSYFTGTDNNSPLPVKLIELSANAKTTDILISWATASEKNSNRFEIERSKDGKVFQYTGTIKAAGNSNSLSKYSFTDKGILKENVSSLYYRLKMIDNDGTFEYSKIARVAKDSKQQVEGIQVYPNPFNSEVYVNVYSESETIADIKVMDIQGKLVYQTQYDLVKGNNLLSIEEAGKFNPGVYFISITTNGENSVIKLIKK